MRRTAVAALALTALTVLAGCGDDDADQKDPKPESAASTVTDDPTESSDPTAPESSTASSSTTAAEEAGNAAKVEEVAAKLDCTAAAGTAGFDGETEHVCGPYLVVDWSTAGVSEQEMFTKIDNWVDEERPVWLYTGDLVLVYGTQENLDAVSSAFE